MTWTWDATDLSTELAQVRSRIGDTNDKDQLLSDEQINALLADSPVPVAALRAIDHIIAKLARDHDRSGLGYSVTKDMIANYRLLQESLRTEAADGGAEAKFTGESTTEKQTERDTADIEQALFYRGQFDIP